MGVVRAFPGEAFSEQRVRMVMACTAVEVRPPRSGVVGVTAAYPGTVVGARLERMPGVAEADLETAAGLVADNVLPVAEHLLDGYTKADYREAVRRLLLARPDRLAAAQAWLRGGDDDER